MSKNKFCNLKVLTNESAVEQFFTIRLLNDLGYGDRDIKPKHSLEALVVGKGSKKEVYKPDYACFIKGKPRLVVDAKGPDLNVDDFLYQVSGYALSLNQKFKKENPVQFTILTNGIITKLYRWDKEKPLISLKFADFVQNDPQYMQLQKLISHDSLSAQLKRGEPYSELTEPFEFRKPDIKEIENIFRACHNLVWKKEKISPTDAFYEFLKLFFVKLYNDKLIHEKFFKQNKKPKQNDFPFSLGWIEKQEEIDIKNPIAHTLFAKLRGDLERQIISKKKKRIFSSDEKLNLKPSTVRDIVRLLEHIDLHGIDEDLNGKLFEHFLSATIRGRDLGQFFTPRNVVKFMTELASLNVAREHIDTVLDACCGSGGFLIDAMTNMHSKIKTNKSLSDIEKEKLDKKLVEGHLWGADANLKIVRVARINMYLHGDGGNKIYWLPDSLDKNFEIEEGIEEELRKEAEEFKETILGKQLRFDVVLTNPPFAMRYEVEKEDEKKILEEFEIAHENCKLESKKLKASVKSNVLFLERYGDLLNAHGKLLSIIDESVLNTDSHKDVRDWIRKNFLIKAIISLPKNAFVNAGSGVKTSVLYLVKKETKNEQQFAVFRAFSENIGHNDAGRPTPKLNDLPVILAEFRKWEHGT